MLPTNYAPVCRGVARGRAMAQLQPGIMEGVQEAAAGGNTLRVLLTHLHKYRQLKEMPHLS